MKSLQEIIGQAFIWADYIVGQFIGERCELCRHYTYFGIMKDADYKVVWCIPCTHAELSRHRVLPQTDDWIEIRK